jgi:hypothetical protein
MKFRKSKTGMKFRKSIVAATLVLGSVAAPVALASTAQAAGSGLSYFYTGSTAHKYIGDDRQSGTTITSDTVVPGFSDCFSARSVRTTIRLPNGATVTGSSLIGQCRHSISMNLQGYSLLQAQTTHVVTTWNGVDYSFTM